MMGSGKTTIAKELSIKLKKDFLDTDILVEKKVNKTINQIFEEDGEPKFRELEKQVIKDISTVQNKIIATGGGAVLFKENIDNLKKNGFIIFVDRSISDIIQTIKITEQENRPIIKADINKLYKVYEKRINIYKENANYILKNDKSLFEVLQNLIKELEKIKKN